MNCPLCHDLSVKGIFTAPNKHGRHLWDKDDLFDFFRCSACDVIFIANVSPDSKYYSKYYPVDYYKGEFKSGLLKRFLDLWGRTSFKEKTNAILNACRQPGTDKLKVLDVGCGCGDFLAHLYPRRFERFGVEINTTGLALTKERGINVFENLKDVVSSGMSFHIVTLWHVLEHLASPLDALAEIRQIMEKDGILAIATPNTNSLGFKLGQKQWFHLDAPRHLFLYNSKSINMLFHKAGFEIVRTCNPFYDYPLDLFWSICERPEKFLIYPFYPFFKLIARETLMVVCRKK
jgi:SAM-dependent methyltransferase